MPKATKSASANVPSPAAALIARVAGRTATPDTPSEAALAELRAVIEHNDSLRGNYGRVRAEDAVEMLAALGWGGASRTALNTLCRKILRRRSYGTP